MLTTPEAIRDYSRRENKSSLAPLILIPYDGLETAAEKSFVKELLQGGRTVEIVPRGTGPLPPRTPDFIIDGQPIELKTLSQVKNQTEDGLSKALSSTIMNARGQSGNIVIDARGQAGMTVKAAERGVIRAFGRDVENKIQGVSVITKEGTVFIPRLPK